jgi:hypothetical protein
MSKNAAKKEDNSQQKQDAYEYWISYNVRCKFRGKVTTTMTNSTTVLVPSRHRDEIRPPEGGTPRKNNNKLLY